MCDTGRVNDTAPTALLDERRMKAAMDSWSLACGRRLRDRRRSLHVSQAALAIAIGKTIQTVSQYELGVVTPVDSARHAIACALLCEVGDIWPPLDRAHVMAVALAKVA